MQREPETGSRTPSPYSEDDSDYWDEEEWQKTPPHGGPTPPKQFDTYSQEADSDMDTPAKAKFYADLAKSNPKYEKKAKWWANWIESQARYEAERKEEEERDKKWAEEHPREKNPWHFEIDYGNPEDDVEEVDRPLKKRKEGKKSSSTPEEAESKPGCRKKDAKRSLKF